MILTLVRFAYMEQRTLGWLTVGALKVATIERPWLSHEAGPGGKRQMSCVPDGDYDVRPWSSEKFPDTFILTNPTLGVYAQPGDIPAGQTWGRSAILIHGGNRVADVIGCVAVGLTHGMMFGEPAVLASQIALGKIRTALGKETHRLTIRPTQGTLEIAA